jgi:o-succinylbenzoate---CoA ligase
VLLTPVDNSAIVAAVAAALDGGPAVLPLPSDDPRADELRAAMAVDEPTLAGTAVVVATSGSTGVPKGVELSAAALRASAAATHARLGGPGQWLLALPAHHIAGVQVIVRSLLAGYAPVLRGYDGVTEMTGPRRYTSLVPTQLVRLLDDPAGVEALCSFDAVLLGGAAAPESLVARARAAGVRVLTTYGMSETAGGCVYDGQPLDGVRVRLVDGVISLAGPMLASGYRRDPVGTAAAFVDGWFRTSDLGVLSPDGSLSVSGRADFMINTGGVKVAPAAVEAVLAAQPGVAEACVVDLPDPEWGQLVAAAVVPVDAARPPAVADLRAAVRARLGGPATPKIVRFVAALPLQGPGKVNRIGVKDMLRGT